MSTKKTFILIIAIIVNLSILLMELFDFQFSLLIDPITVFLIYFVLMIVGRITSIVIIPLRGFKKPLSYIPLLLVVLAIFLPSNDLDHTVHFLMKRNSLNTIDELSEESGIYTMTDMLRYHKTINNMSLSNESEYTTREEIQNAFGEYIESEDLDINKIALIQERLIDSNIVSLFRTEDYLILIVGGLPDSEHGYIKPLKKEIKRGEILPPYGYKVIKLIAFHGEWYYFYSS